MSGQNLVVAYRENGNYVVFLTDSDTDSKSLIKDFEDKGVSALASYLESFDDDKDKFFDELDGNLEAAIPYSRDRLSVVFSRYFS